MLTDRHPSSLVFVTVTPTPPTPLEGLARALAVLVERDERLDVAWHADGHAVELGGADDEHLEQVLDALKRAFSVTAATSRPRVDLKRARVDRIDGQAWVDIEPWMDVEVQARPFYVPRLRDAWPRLRQSTHLDSTTSLVILRCRAPLAEVFGLRRAVYDMTHGEASATVVLWGYAPRDEDDEPGAPVRTSRR